MGTTCSCSRFHNGSQPPEQVNLYKYVTLNLPVCARYRSFLTDFTLIRYRGLHKFVVGIAQNCKLVTLI